MSTKYWRGQTADLEIEDDDGNEIPIGVLDEPEVSAPEQEVQELRGSGSTEWVDLQKTETAVGVTGEISAWDMRSWDDLIDYDSEADKLDDSAEVATFEVTVIYEASDGSTKTIPVVEAYIDGSIPLGGSREEWIGMSLEMRGRTIEGMENDDAEEE